MSRLCLARTQAPSFSGSFSFLEISSLHADRHHRRTGRGKARSAAVAAAESLLPCAAAAPRRARARSTSALWYSTTGEPPPPRGPCHRLCTASGKRRLERQLAHFCFTVFVCFRTPALTLSSVRKRAAGGVGRGLARTRCGVLRVRSFHTPRCCARCRRRHSCDEPAHSIGARPWSGGACFAKRAHSWLVVRQGDPGQLAVRRVITGEVGENTFRVRSRCSKPRSKMNLKLVRWL